MAHSHSTDLVKTYSKNRSRDADEVRHRRGKILDEFKRKNRNEDVLPVHGSDERVGCLDAGGQARKLLGHHDDSPLPKHRRKHLNHARRIHGVEVLR